MIAINDVYIKFQIEARLRITWLKINDIMKYHVDSAVVVFSHLIFYYSWASKSKLHVCAAGAWRIKFLWEILCWSMIFDPLILQQRCKTISWLCICRNVWWFYIFRYDSSFASLFSHWHLSKSGSLSGYGTKWDRRKEIIVSSNAQINKWFFCASAHECLHWFPLNKKKRKNQVHITTEVDCVRSYQIKILTHINEMVLFFL